MKRSLSIFLDFLRVVAALAVLIGHADMLGFLRIQLPDGFGHRWVVVFFVLSGLIISYTTATKHHDAKDYAIARLSRLSSVVIPALLFTLAVDLFVSWAAPELHHARARPNWRLRYFLSFFYLQEIWTLSASPPSNGPLWSLAYEFWYYTLFALAWFPKPRVARFGSVALCAAFVGPKILLLLPVWLLGVAVYYAMSRVGSGAGWKVGFWGCAVLFLFLVWRPLPSPFAWRGGYAPLFYSAEFLPDFALGAVVAGMILCFAAGYRELAFPSGLGKIIRTAANVTFSCYLFHFPMFLAAKALFGRLAANSWESILVVIGVIGGVAAIGTQTELRRAIWTRWILGIFGIFERKPMVADPEAAPIHK